MVCDCPQDRRDLKMVELSQLFFAGEMCVSFLMSKFA